MSFGWLFLCWRVFLCLIAIIDSLIAIIDSFIAIIDSGAAEAVFLAEATKSGDYELCFVNGDEDELTAVQRADLKAADGYGFPRVFFLFPA